MPLPPPCTSNAPPSGELRELEHIQEDGEEDLGNRRRLLERERTGTCIAEPAWTTTSSA